MKLFTLIPMTGLLLTVSVTPALADLGRQPLANITDQQMCTKLAAALIKQEQRTAASLNPDGKHVDSAHQVGNEGTAL